MKTEYIVQVKKWFAGFGCGGYWENSKWKYESRADAEWMAAYQRVIKRKTTRVLKRETFENSD